MSFVCARCSIRLRAIGALDLDITFRRDLRPHKFVAYSYRGKDLVLLISFPVLRCLRTVSISSLVGLGFAGKKETTELEETGIGNTSE